ncbi:hypothetical protein BDU57DRAFT_256513 [Ampelomyces quisqualis]|uniref:Uncharacterized protein n=1 Tax=Ampelomyces quisqualis TaxID=50730 RepID=A0A6A5QMX3_AMPQU|nr:hypothetical protein BDU57DRAFT_256513 [Ampelomyces quisqualis]
MGQTELRDLRSCSAHGYVIAYLHGVVLLMSMSGFRLSHPKTHIVVASNTIPRTRSTDAKGMPRIPNDVGTPGATGLFVLRQHLHSSTLPYLATNLCQDTICK